jgi:uncharacterized protein YukE
MDMKTINEREYFDICVKVLAGDAANCYGNEQQRLQRTLDKVNLLLETLGYKVTKTED